MSVVSNPLIGKTKKAMGNVVFSTWKGINVLKEKPASVANPQTDAQVQQRSAFAQLVAAFRRMPSAIRAGFKKLAVKKSEFNAFMAANLTEAFNMSTPGVATLQPADVLVSKGTIATTPITTVVADRSSNSITVTHPTAASQPGQSASDESIVCAYNETKNEWAGEVVGLLRSAGSTGITLPDNWDTGDTLFVYLAFRNPISGESSDSVNDSTTIVA